MIEDILELRKKEAEAVLNIPVTDQFEKAVNIIYERVHTKGGKLVTSGMGKAGQIAINMATTFSSTGTPAIYLHPSDAQHGDLGVMQKNDALLLISNSGKTREIVELIFLAKRLIPEIPIIVITSNPKSKVADAADALLETGNPKEVCTLELTPTTSTTTMTVIGDMLVVMLMKKIGFTNKEYSLRHHGGYLGEKSRNNAEKNQ
jgi:arabinose-5-phosphate isomerase